MTLSNRLFLQLPCGARVSIVTGENAYCTPRDDNGPYTEVEVGTWAPLPTLARYSDGPVSPAGTLTVYAYVPVADLLRALTPCLTNEADYYEDI